VSGARSVIWPECQVRAVSDPINVERLKAWDADTGCPDIVVRLTAGLHAWTRYAGRRLVPSERRRLKRSSAS
jgi:hypothetical protein